MEELDTLDHSPKRRRLGDKNPFRTFTNYHEHETQKSELEFDDLRHESLNHILKHNMEIFKHNDMHNLDDGIDDDENNNNDNSLSGESSTTNCIGQDLIGMAKCSNGSKDDDNDDDDTTLVHFNQLIDDERDSEMNEDDGVSFSILILPSLTRFLE